MAILDHMIALAREAQGRAYAPYSRFHVGACLRTESGQLFAGCNVENAAYPQGQCAEASAIGNLVGAGEARIVEVVVVGDGAALCTPCGGCRQRLNEFAAGTTQIHVCGPDGVRLTVSLGELLPYSFGPENLSEQGG